MVKKLVETQLEIEEFSRHEPFEKTRSKCILEEGLSLAKSFLKYKGNPAEMYRDRDMRVFINPFIEYCKGEISLPVAQKEKVDMVTEWTETNGEFLHEDIIRSFFEMYIGKIFDDVIHGLESDNKEVAQESAILIVTAFKEALHKNKRIKKLIGEAEERGHLKFKEEIGRAYRTIPDDIGVYRDTVIFLRMNEAFIQNHSLNETMNLAEKWGVKIEKESFKKYLHRHGVKKETHGRPKTPDRNDPEIETLLNAHRKDFDQYLFGDEGGSKGFSKMLTGMEKEIL